MAKTVVCLILMSMIAHLHLLSAQTWSPPMRVSRNSASITGQGLTTDDAGTPWCVWCAYDLYVSHYSDTAWSAPDTIHPFLGFMDCDLTTDANGNVWAVAEDEFISACFYNGSFWSNLMQVPNQGSCCHYPIATGDTPGNLWVCWAGGGPGDGHHIWGNTYIQGQWGSPVLISYPGSPEEFAYTMTTDKQGRVWVGWHWFLGFDNRICISFNDGSGWSDTMVIAKYSYSATGPALTVDTAGRVWAAWIHADSGDPNYMVSASYYDGNAWAEPMLVGIGSFNVALTSDDGGLVWLTWVNPENDICYSYWDGSNWSNPAPVDTNPAYDSWPRMAFDGERIWVTWISDRGDSAGVYASYTYGLDVEEKPTANPISVPVLSQNYPNPFVQTTEIRYEISEKANTRQKSVASMGIYDVSGRLVKQFDQLTNNQSPIIWDGKDDCGSVLPSGVYFYRIKAGNFTDAKRMVLIH